MDLGDLRQDYESAGIDDDSLDPDPIVQYGQWFDDAQTAGLYEPNAIAVSSVDADGWPATRIVLLKAFDVHGFVFYTNYESDKGQQLIANPKCAVTSAWIELRRQVRITGVARRLDPAASDAYFARRPRGSQLGAWASPQSSVITGRDELDDQWREMEERFADGEVPRPPHWGGIVVEPTVVEFWQGRTNRLHDRIRYARTDGATGPWHRERLAP